MLTQLYINLTYAIRKLNSKRYVSFRSNSGYGYASIGASDLLNLIITSDRLEESLQPLE